MTGSSADGAASAEGLHGHDSTLALGVPLAIGLVWAALPQNRLALAAQALLCVVAVGVFLIHAKRASRHWGRIDESWALIASDRRGPMAPQEVAARHAAPGLYVSDTPEVRSTIAAGLGMLRRSRFPLYCTRAPAPEQAPP